MTVLVHGLGCSHRYWARLWPLLPGARCPDLAGASVDALADDLERFVAPETILVGNSLGAQVAVEVALRRPGEVRGLVLIGPTIDARRRSFGSQLARLALDCLREPATLLPVLARDYASWGTARVLRTARSMLDDRIEDKLPGLDVSVLVVRGERDPICPRGWADIAASRAGRGRLVAVPAAAAHAVHWSHPHVVVRLVEELQQQLGEG